MGSSGKKKTTMAKLARESRVRERRLQKQARKDARKLGLTQPVDLDDDAPEAAFGSPGDADDATAPVARTPSDADEATAPVARTPHDADDATAPVARTPQDARDVTAPVAGASDE
jgi:hypothetical protein